MVYQAVWDQVADACQLEVLASNSKGTAFDTEVSRLALPTVPDPVHLAVPPTTSHTLASGEVAIPRDSTLDAHPSECGPGLRLAGLFTGRPVVLAS